MIHQLGSNCWCKPLILQVCIHCVDDPDKDCIVCKNKRLIIPRRRTRYGYVYVHDHTVSTRIIKNDPLVDIFFQGAKWEDILSFFGKSTRGDEHGISSNRN